MLRFFPLLAVTTAIGFGVAALTPRVSADVIELKSGGRLHGKVINSSEKNPTHWELELTDGTRMRIKPSAVRSLAIKQDLESKYEQWARGAADSEPEHARMVTQLESMKLPALADAHRERLVELAPDSEGSKSAWASLGYSKDESGRWIRRVKRYALLGLDAKGKFPEDQALAEAEEAARVARATAAKKLDLAIKNLSDARRRADAAQALATWEDPVAIPRMLQLLTKDQKSVSDEVASYLVNALGRMHASGSIGALVDVAIQNDSLVIRGQAIDYLKQHGGDAAAAMAASRLIYDKKKSPLPFQRAALILGELKDPRVVRRLFDLLVTVHESAPIAQPGTSAGFSPTGGTSFGSGGKPKIMRTTVNNQEVLSALQSITGQNLGFDTEKWREWYAQQHAHVDVDLRRDP
jgi:hypothetical protein